MPVAEANHVDALAAVVRRGADLVQLRGEGGASWLPSQHRITVGAQLTPSKHRRKSDRLTICDPPHVLEIPAQGLHGEPGCKLPVDPLMIVRSGLVVEGVASVVT